MSRTVLIDADICAVASAHQGQRVYDWGDDGGPVVSVNEDMAFDNLTKRIETIRKHAAADEVVICLSDPGRRYFRHELEPTYKSNRKGQEAPVLLGPLKEFLSENYRSYMKPKLEADDVLGILGSSPRFIKGEKVIASTDKDLLQVPGMHLNTNNVSGGVFEVTEEAGKRWHLMQTLMGDTTDGYKGRPGVGPVKAAEILDELDPNSPEAWEAVVESFAQAGLDEEHALLQARLAYIIQHDRWDNKNKEVLLWEPPH